MKNKKNIILLVVILILTSISSFAETKKLKEIGRYTLVRIKGQVPTSEVMKILVDRYAGDIKYGFDMAGYGDLYLPFMDQLKSSTFKEDTLAIGDKMMWMLFRSFRKVKIVKDLEWAGKEPLPIFTFTVVKNYKHYNFIMPRACGNISLRNVEEVIPDATCNIQVDPVKANLNDPISIDMSGSQNAKSMEIEVLGPDGTRIATKTLSPDSPRWQTKFSTPGEYTFRAKAVNSEGKTSTNFCEAKTYINFPPICKLWTSCIPCKDFVGHPITFDTSNSTDPDGEVVKSDCEITDESGNVVATNSDTTKPFSWEKIFEKPGIYTITAVVTDDFGAVSKPDSVQIEVSQKRLFMLVEGFPQWARGSYGPYLGARFGMLYQIVPATLDLVISAGGSVALKGEPWKSFISANALLNVNAGPAYFGGGLGFDTKVKDTRKADVVLVGNIGFNLFNSTTSIGSIFGEVRAPISKDTEFAKHHKLVLGFRMLF